MGYYRPVQRWHKGKQEEYKDRLAKVEEIAEAQRIPKPFLSKIFHKLARERVLKSYKGPTGGVTLAVPPDIITAGEKEPYYTNSTHLPVNYTDDPIEALEHQNSWLYCMLG